MDGWLKLSSFGVGMRNTSPVTVSSNWKGKSSSEKLEANQNNSSFYSGGWVKLVFTFFCWLETTSTFTFSRTAERVREVVRCTSLVVGKAHRPISLIVLGCHTVRTVNRQLQVVCSQAMTMCIRVREKTTYTLDDNERMILNHFVAPFLGKYTKTEEKKCKPCNILSGDGSMPGTKLAGLKAICSTSAK